MKAELTKGMKDYIEKTTIAYNARRQDYSNTYLKVKYTTGTEYFPLKQRFTELYGNSIYNKLKVLDNLRLYSFWTLTTKVDGTVLGFHNVLDLVKKGWRDLRSLLAKKGLKKLLYLRVYELTKNYGLHIHVAFYSPMTEEQVIALSLFWRRTRGFVKIYVYSMHRSEFESSVVRDAWSPYVEPRLLYPKVYAQRRESWVTGNELIFSKPVDVRIDQKVSSYIYKYMVKRPNKSHQAVLSDNRIRTYSCSMQLNKLVKLMRDKFKEDNYVERGDVIDVSIYQMPWLEELEQMQDFYRKLKQRSSDRTKPLFNIELVLKYNEVSNEVIHLAVNFNDTAFSIVSTDRPYYPRKWSSYGDRGFRVANAVWDY